MKKSLVARGITGIVASLLGVGLVGCGAATDQEAAEIGSTSEALTSDADVADFTLTARYEAASCVLNATRDWDGPGGNAASARDVMLVVGGFSDSGSSFDDAKLYNPVENVWVAADSLPMGEGGRGGAKLLALGNGKCVLVGGLSQRAGAGSAVRANAYVFDAGQAAGSQWVAAGSLNAGRTQFAVSKCGTSSQVAVLGGHDATSDTSPVAAANTIEVWNGSTGGAATWTAQNKLNPQVSAFAFAVQDPTSTLGKWVVAGGYSSAGAEGEVQTFTSDGSCAFTKLTNEAQLRDDGNTNNNRGRVGAAAVFGLFDHDSDATTTSVYVAAGDDRTGTLPTDVQRFTVKWSGTGTLGSVFTAQHTGAGVSLPTGVRMAKVVNFASNKVMLVSGEDDTSATLLESPPVDQAQVLDVSAAASTTPAFSSVTLNRNYLATAAEFLNSKVYLSTGLVTQDTVAPISDTLTAKTQSVTP